MVDGVTPRLPLLFFNLVSSSIPGVVVGVVVCGDVGIVVADEDWVGELNLRILLRK